MQRRRRTKIWEGGRGVGVAHFARSCSQDISGPFMGTGPGGAHATLSSVVVSLMLAYPHSSALDPCSSRFLFDCDLLPSHCGPQLSTLLVPPSLSVCLCLSFTRCAYLPRYCKPSCQPVHRSARPAATVYTCLYIHVARLGISTSVPVLWPFGRTATQCKLSLSVLGSPPAAAIGLAASNFHDSWYRSFGHGPK